MISKNVSDNSAHKAKLKELQNRLVDANISVKRLDDRDELISRNSYLQKQLKELNAQRSEKEYLLALTVEFERKQAQLIEDKINAAFEFVTFKLFELQKNGDVKACCTPMLDGVIYSQLSCGEKFKVACDVLKTLQRHYNVELPVFIDDAESYTFNSYVDLPNQIIQLVAREGELQIEIKTDKEKAA